MANDTPFCNAVVKRLKLRNDYQLLISPEERCQQNKNGKEF